MQVNRQVTERILTAFGHREPDRVPVWESIQNQAVYDAFAPGVPFPECAAIACERLGIDATYGCMPAVTEERTEGDLVHAAQTVWQTRPAFRSLEDLRRWRPPPLNERGLEERMLAEHEAAQATYAPHTLYLPQSGGWGFLPGYDSTTFSVVALAMAEDISLLRGFWDSQAEHAIARNTVTARHGLAPVIQCCEDVAWKGGLLVSPDLLRAEFFPRFRRVIAPLKEAGIKVVWHTDGDVGAVVDDAIECGFDGLNPIEPCPGWGLGDLKRRYGDRLTFVGNVGGIHHVLPFGSPDDVRADVRRCVREAGDGGGLVLQAGDGQIMPDCPLENIVAYLDEAHRTP